MTHSAGLGLPRNKEPFLSLEQNISQRMVQPCCDFSVNLAMSSWGTAFRKIEISIPAKNCASSCQLNCLRQWPDATDDFEKSAPVTMASLLI